MLRGRKLSQSDPEMVCVVEGIEEILVLIECQLQKKQTRVSALILTKRMYICQLRESLEDERKFLGKSLCCIFDLASVEAYYLSANSCFVQVMSPTSYPADLEACSDLGWKASLCAA